MTSLPVIVVGAGGHAAVVAEALMCSGATVIGFTDIDSKRHGKKLCGVPVIGNDDTLLNFDKARILLANGIGAVGGDAILLRKRIQMKLQAAGWSFRSVIHPSSTVSHSAILGKNIHLMAGAIVQPGATVGDGCIINTRVVIEHDVNIGSWSHVASGAIVCGDTHIGKLCHVGAGATVIQGLCIGDNTLIGAGAAVVKNFTGGGVLVGVPAQKRDRRI